MQIYGLKLHYFFRFFEDNNCVVFDISEKDTEKKMDLIYKDLKSNPYKYIENIKNENGISNLICIVGAKDGNIDSSNGIGKSSILEAICYAFFDKLVRKGIAGSSAATRINNSFHSKMKESYVEVIFEENSKMYLLKRGRSFSKNQKTNQPILDLFEYDKDGSLISLSGHTISRTEEESLKKIIPMDYDIFLNGIMFGQGDAGKYLFGSDKVKKDMLISILNLDSLVLGQLEAIREEKNKTDKEVKVLEAQEVIYSEKLKNYKPPKLIKEDIDRSNKDIYIYENEIHEISEKLEKLLSSEEIKEFESLKTKLEELYNNKKSIENSTSEKFKIINESLNKINEEGRELSKIKMLNLTNRLSKYNRQLEVSLKNIEEFNYEEAMEKYGYIQVAKNEIGKRETSLREKKETHSSLLKRSGEYKITLDQFSKEFKKFEIHLSRNEEFECSYCKTMVPINHTEDQFSFYQKEIDTVNGKISRNKLKISSVESEIDKLEQDIYNFNKIISEESLISNQVKTWKDNKLNLENLKELKSECEKEIEECKSKILLLKDEKLKYEKDLISCKEDFKKQEENINQEILNFEQVLKDKSLKSQTIIEEINSLKVKNIEFSKKIYSLKEKIGSLESDLKNIKIDYVSYKQIKENLFNKKKEYNRWCILNDIHGIDGIQTRIIKKYLPLLNSYIKQYLDILTNGEMNIETKINDKSKIDMVISGGSSDTFEMLSGGEKMLVKLAVDISLALLSFVRSNKKPELICLDEIFGPLDEKNTNSVFDLLRFLSGKFSRVILISHNPNVNDKINNKIYINKESGTYGMSRILRKINC